jgi:hypothetical protein
MSARIRPRGGGGVPRIDTSAVTTINADRRVNAKIGASHRGTLYRFLAECFGIISVRRAAAAA